MKLIYLLIIGVILYIVFIRNDFGLIEGYGCGCDKQPKLIPPFIDQYEMKSDSPLCEECKQWPDQCKCWGSRWWYPLANIVQHDPYA